MGLQRTKSTIISWAAHCALRCPRSRRVPKHYQSHGGYKTRRKASYNAKNDLSCDMTKPTKWLCAQRRLRSAWASSLSAWRKLGSLTTHQAHSEDSNQTVGCPGWSESSVGAHSFCWFCHVVAHFWRFWICRWKGNDQETTQSNSTCFPRLHT